MPIQPIGKRLETPLPLPNGFSKEADRTQT